MAHWYTWDRNRTLCDVLEEMRKCLASLQLAPLKGLIEEAQVMGNRMEAGLNDKADLEEMHQSKKKLQAEIKALEDRKNELKPESD